MGQTGFVLLGVVGLWIAYLVPHRLRLRQQLAEARVDDRFSGRLRVLAVGSGEPRPTTQVPTVRVLLHPHRALTGGDMERPHVTTDRTTAQAARQEAAARAHRAARLTRRKAAARRRAMLSALLVVAMVGGWAAGIVQGGAALWLGAAPTLLLTTVLVLGRRAVVAGNRADAAWAARNVDRVLLPPGERAVLVRPERVVGHAVRASEDDTQTMARVAAQAEAAPAVAEVAEEAAAETAGTWAPVPVPRPSYTLKPEARRAEPAPLTAEDLAGSVAMSEPSEHVDVAPAAEAPEAAPEAAGLDLDAVLQRRRAAGA